MSNSTGWIVAVIILLAVIAVGAFVWTQNNSSKGTGAKIETVLPIGGGR
jgi:hypothetical protein